MTEIVPAEPASAAVPPQPIPTDQLHFALPPSFDDVAAERQYRKERLAAALRLFGRFGFEEGVAGHITARDPEFTDHFWVNPFGMSFQHITVSDLILVNHAGQVVKGRYHVNQAAFAIHSQVHQARPDVVAAAHSHSVHGRALSALGELLEPITQDVCAFYEDHALFDDYTGVVLDEEEGRRIAGGARPAQGGHPAQPRAADRRRLGGRGGLVVHHHGAVLPGPAHRQGGRQAGAHQPRERAADPQPTGQRPGGLDQLPAAVPADHPQRARPPGLKFPHRLSACRPPSVPVVEGVRLPYGQKGGRR